MRLRQVKSSSSPCEWHWRRAVLYQRNWRGDTSIPVIDEGRWRRGQRWDLEKGEELRKCGGDEVGFGVGFGEESGMRIGKLGLESRKAQLGK
ncbi:hypothetical protein Droror1_Dr00027093, partial [Drosera rotundifolia]